MLLPVHPDTALSAQLKPHATEQTNTLRLVTGILELEGINHTARKVKIYQLKSLKCVIVSAHLASVCRSLMVVIQLNNK